MAKAREVAGLSGGMRFGEAAGRTVAVRAQELADAAEGVLDVEDPERVHRMRVASRRLRAVLEVYQGCLDPKAYKPLLAEVKVLADALGARRDPDVALIGLAKLGEQLPAEDQGGVELLAAEAREARERGNAVLEAELARAQELRLYDRLQELAASVQDETGTEATA